MMIMVVMMMVMVMMNNINNGGREVGLEEAGNVSCVGGRVWVGQGSM